MDEIDGRQFDELYVISDLHLGGAAGFQIFDQAHELRAFLDSLAKGANAKSAAEKSVALVINGDLVDFLADEKASAFDPEGAVGKLETIFKEKAFLPVWDGLRVFVKTPGRTLVITLGNHDVELALPWVRERLIFELANDDEAARGRIVLAFDGSGFRCKVRNTRVLCVHGNEVDAWNMIDYERLRVIGRNLVLGQPAETWVPNPGTRLVVNVMNQIKRRHPFVDLLKPETEAVVPILVALDAAKEAEILEIGSVAAQRAWDQVRHYFGFLGEEQRPMFAPPLASRGTRSFQPMTSLAALRRAEKQMQDGVDPFDLISRAALSQQLGWGDWVSGALSAIRFRPREESLRKVLGGLQQDMSFELSTKDETFDRLDKLSGSQIDIVIAGHTHLERSIRRGTARGHYYNSGTWVKLMKLTEQQLSIDAEFRKFFEAVESLDAGNLEPYVFRTCTVVRVRSHLGGRAQAELCHFAGGRLKEAPGTEFQGQ